MAFGTIGLSTFRWNAAQKSLALIALFPLITAGLFWCQLYLIYFFLGDTRYLSPESALSANEVFFGWGGITFIVALAVWLVVAWRYQDSIVRGLCLSHSVTAREEPQLYAMLESLCIAQGMLTPELEIIETAARNAFVCELDPETQRIFVTRGLLEMLQPDEIEAVLAHELAHILNGDNRLVAFSIAFCDLYPALTIQIDSYGRMKAPGGRPAWNPIFFIHPFTFVLLAPLWGGYIATSILRVLFHIHRELDADAHAYQITKNANALMRALIRINRRARMPFVTQNIRFLCIDNPVGGFFATHPRLSKRLNSLSELSQLPIPELEPGEPAAVYRRFRRPPLIERFVQREKSRPWR